MVKDPIRIFQVSDAHFFSNPNKSLLGVNTQESFAAVLKLMMSYPQKPHGILFVGDLSQDGSMDSYQALAEAFEDFDLPVYWVPGNHDIPGNMQSFFPFKNFKSEKQIILGNWQFVLLNTHKDHSVAGFVSEPDLSFMQNCLRQYPTHHTVIVMHHHPVTVHSAWLDKIGVINADQFWNCVEPYSQVKAVLFGHVHQICEGRKANVDYFSSPSTCFQFKPKQPEFGLENIPPGFRWLEFFSDGRIKTGVERTSEYIGIFDERAAGY